MGESANQQQPLQAEAMPAEAAAGLRLHTKPTNRWVYLGRDLLGSAKGMTGAIIVLLALIAAIGAPIIAPTSPTNQVVEDRFAPPSFIDPESNRLAGGDNLGRDILSRTIHGSRVSVFVGLIVISIASIVGSSLGVIAGYAGGWLDSIIMRLADLQLSFPFILLALIFMAILGPGFWSIVVALTVAIWVNYARTVRGETLKLRESEYVIAAKAIGARSPRVLAVHLVPNLIHTIIVLATVDLAFVIIFESSLTFLGLGVQPPTASWGVMLAEGRNYMSDSPWMSIFPGIAIVLTVVGINLLGDWLRDALDPSLRNR